MNLFRRLQWVCLIFVCVILIGLCPNPAMANEARPIIKVGYDQAYPPFSYLDERGMPAGFNIDLIQSLARSANIKLELFPKSSAELPDALSSGQIDLILGLKYNAAYNEMFDFTQSIMDISTVLVVPKTDNSIYNLSDLKNKIVSVYSDSSEFEWVRNIRGAKLNVSSSPMNAFNMFIHGRSDAFIGDSWLVEYLLRQMNLRQQFEVRINYMLPNEYAFAVRKGNFELLTIVNDGLDQLKQSGDYTSIYKDWFNLLDTTWWRTLIWVPSVLTFLAAIVVILIYTINKKLKMEVDRQTIRLSNHLAFQSQILNAVDNGIISFDSTGVIKLINFRLLEILGMKENPTGTNINKHPEMAEIHNIVRNTDALTVKEGEFSLHSGQEEKSIHYYVTALNSESEVSDGWLISLQDHTQQINLQKKLVLQEKLRSLGQLVAGIAHELKNPLTSMKMFIELLPLKLENERFRADLIKHVPEDFERINNLVDDLLDYTRRKKPEKEWIHLNQYITSILKTIGHASADYIAFSVNIPPSTRIFIDRQRMKQVFINIIMNAMDAVSTSKTKHIMIRSMESEREIKIQIKDTGSGIKPSDLPNLFQPFYTTKDQGVGIGLYICYNIVQEHEGDIDVESTLGEGTTFTLNIPKGEF